MTHLYRGDDVALAAVQGLHLPHVLLRQTEVAHLQVLQDSGRGDALGDADHAPLDLPPADQSRPSVKVQDRPGGQAGVGLPSETFWVRYRNVHSLPVSIRDQDDP